MTRLSKRARNTSIIASIAIISYIAVSLLFVMPDGVIRTAAKPITDAASPYFNQKWNVFAPNIAKTNPKLLIQAQWLDDNGERVYSDWVNVTEIDFAALPGSIHPTRAHKTSYNLLTRYNTRYRNLNSEQRTIVRDTFIKRDGEGFAAKTRSEITDELREHGSNTGQIRSLLREDDIVKEFATYFASAYFNEDVVRVRWQIYREYPNTFEDRHIAESVREPSQITFGWRHVDDDIDPKKLKLFNEYITRNTDER